MTLKTDAADSKKETGGWDLVIVLIQAVSIAVLLRIFLFQPFNIPSGSMIPTLLVGDYLFVSKYSYGYSQHSFPSLMHVSFEGRFLASDPNRGDVIVFKTPSDNSTDYIKRLIGLPGDRIQMKAGQLYINGSAIPRQRAADAVMNSRCGKQPVHQYIETLPEGKSYLTQKLSETCADNRLGALDDTDVYVVPPNHYFMMGDNRDDSADSRFQGPSYVGYVPRDNLVGRARILWFSIDEKASWFAPWRWPFEIRWSRFLNVIR